MNVWKCASGKEISFLTISKLTKNVTIPGPIIPNPRMLILQRSLLLKDENKTGRILRVWIAKVSKNENT